MKQQLCTIALSGLLAFGMNAAIASAQDSSAQQGSTMQQGSMQQGSMQGPGGAGGHHRMMDPDQQLAHMTKRYNLTADQQTQLKPILAANQQQMMQMHSDMSMSKQDKIAKMQSMREDSKQKVEAVLTPDQKAKFEQDQTRMQQRRADRMQNGGAMGGQDAGAPPPPQ